jgi:hypothetical protein
MPGRFQEASQSKESRKTLVSSHRPNAYQLRECELIMVMYQLSDLFNTGIEKRQYHTFDYGVHWYLIIGYGHMTYHW